MQVVKPPVLYRQVRMRLRPWALFCLDIGLLGALALAGLVRPAQAYVPPLEAMYEELVAGSPTAGSAILEFQCRVYAITADLAAQPPGQPTAQPTLDPGRSFRQRVYWQRGRLLAVETLADDGTVLNVRLLEAGFLQIGQLSATRRFSDADVRPLIYPFLEGRTAVWMDELNFWGVSPSRVENVLLKSGQAYRLVDDADRALWVEKDGNRPIRLSTRIAGGTPLTLAVEFGDFVSFAPKGPEKDKLRIPRKFTYALNGRVFKEVRMTEFEVDPPARKFPVPRLRQQAATVPAGRPQ